MRSKSILVLVVLLVFTPCTFAASIVAWGSNWSGVISDIPDGNDFIAISAGEKWCLALRANGSLAAWGRNNEGQCEIPDGNDFIAIAATSYAGLAIKSDGSLVGWKYVTVPEGNDFIAISGGDSVFLALKSDGTLDYVSDDSWIPGENDFIVVSEGYAHSLALHSNGLIAAWGSNNHGQLDGVPESNDFVSIAAGAYHSIALKSDGTLVAWGWNDYGECSVPLGNDFVAIAGGAYHSLAIRADGSLVAWGENSNGQCDVPDGNDFVAISAGWCYSLGMVLTPITINLLDPNGGEELVAGSTYEISWYTEGTIQEVLIEYSSDNGSNWNVIDTVPNTGSYSWEVPEVNSQQSMLRISDTDYPISPTFSDTSDSWFTMYVCEVNYDLDHNCVINFLDFALLASEWLQCGNPFDSNCVP